MKSVLIHYVFFIGKFLKGALVAMMIISSFLFISSITTYASGTADFITSNYGTSTSTSGYYYRGYAFTVSESTPVTHLIGGGSGGTFIVVLYEGTVSGNDVTPTNLLGHVSFTDTTPNQIGSLSPQVILEPGQTYILAQGRESGSGSHHTVGTIDTSTLISSEPRITSWERSNGQSIYWSNGGDENFLLNNTTDNSDNSTPSIGFRYIDNAEEPQVSTGSFSQDGNTVILNGFLDDAGNANTTLYIETADNPSFINSTLHEVTTTQNDNTAFSYIFTPTP